MTTTILITPAGRFPADHRVVLDGRVIGLVSDEAGAVPGRGRFHAWSAAFGPRGFHATEAAAVERVVSAWLNCEAESTGLMTSRGTVHAARRTGEGLVPTCTTGGGVGPGPKIGAAPIG
ncbi:hypothetical protein [Streptomyces sp. NPDC048606]|uniref:hypothetical protein n=1 Tax=Streptomyces sp. NPDC048606 TaxID=3154726 RepID=UPI003425C047